jgi:hypothetical protein
LALLLPEKPASKVGNTALLPTLNFLSTTIVKKIVGLPFFFSHLYISSLHHDVSFFLKFKYSRGIEHISPSAPPPE